MTIKAENTLNEIQVAGGYFSDKPIQTTATGQFGSQVVNGSITVTGSIAVGNDLTVADALTVTGASTFGGTQTVNSSMVVTGTTTLGVTGQTTPVNLGSGGPQIISGTLAPPANPTGITATLGSLFINLGATGVTNRVYINTNGATGWTYLGTSGA